MSDFNKSDLHNALGSLDEDSFNRNKINLKKKNQTTATQI